MENHLKLSPPDEIFELQSEYGKDLRKNKINGGIGVYLDDVGNPYVLPVVKKVSSFLQNSNFNYLPISGDPAFLDCSARLVLGENIYAHFKPTIAQQGVNGGTNGLYIWGSLIKQMHKKPTIMISSPTWENHKKIFPYLGFSIVEYNHATSDHCFDLNALYQSISKHKGAYILFHGGSTHNPTGINPHKDQWENIVKKLKEYQNTILFDFAYMGLGENIDKDSYPIRLAIRNNIPTSIIISYSKNMTLYQHRTGALLVMGKTKKEKEIVESNLKYIFRIVNSNPPAYGEHIAKTILESKELKKEWVDGLKTMVRSLTKRRQLFANYTKEKFTHVLHQKGLFSLLGLSRKHINRLKKKYGIYLLSNSRINFGGISYNNIKKAAQAVMEELD